MDYQRIIIIIGIAITVYLLLLAWNEDYKQNAPSNGINTEISNQGAIPQMAGQEGDQLAESTSVPSLPAPEHSPASQLPDTPLASEMVPTIDQGSEVQPESTRNPDRFVQVETDVLSATIDTLGGDLFSVSLHQYPTSLETPNEPFVLVDPRNSYSAQTGLIGPNGTDTASGRPQFIPDSLHYNLGDDEQVIVTLTLPDYGDGLTLRKEFVFNRSNYLIEIKYSINNKTNSDWIGAIYAQIKRDGQEPVNVSSNPMGLRPFIGGATWTADEPYHKLEFEDLEDEAYKAKMTGGYIAMVQHYFVSAFIADTEQEYSYQARKLSGQDIYLLGFTSLLNTIPRGGQDSISVKFYAGPKDQYRLKEIAKGLDLTIDYGFLWWLAQPLFYLLTFIQGYVVNWGVAIILLTFVVKLVLYPLSAASFKSNAKLRKLQPQMTRLKEQYGEDRQKFSQEMMALYKKEGANPLGGCLPLLLQMPVFIALYWVLMESVEIRQAPFALWIRDLSALDPYFVLPILMGISMYCLTLIQPAPPDPMQAKIFKMLPIMFTFFFLWFPSGLVLYWLVSNILSILQQWYVTRKYAAGG